VLMGACIIAQLRDWRTESNENRERGFLAGYNPMNTP